MAQNINIAVKSVVLLGQEFLIPLGLQVEDEIELVHQFLNLAARRAGKVYR